MSEPIFIFDPGTHTGKLGDESLRSVTATLGAVGIADFTELRERPDPPPPGFRSWRKYWMHRGSAVHDAGSLIMQGRDSEVETWLSGLAAPFAYWRGYIEAIKKFLFDSRFKMLLSEVPVYDPLHKFFGVPDILGLFQGAPCLPDFKLTKARRGTQIQTAAYKVALPSLGHEPYGYVWCKEHHDRLGIELHKDGSYDLEWYDDARDEYLWFAALALAQWKDNGESRHARHADAA